jgi:hypothetical protein
MKPKRINKRLRNPGGRPRRAKNLITFQHLAIYPRTHARIKRNAMLAGKSMAEYMEELVP